MILCHVVVIILNSGIKLEKLSVSKEQIEKTE
jgi:hypothetical protein